MVLATRRVGLGFHARVEDCSVIVMKNALESLHPARRAGEGRQGRRVGWPTSVGALESQRPSARLAWGPTANKRPNPGSSADLRQNQDDSIDEKSTVMRQLAIREGAR